jgi:hypothetical protein
MIHERITSTALAVLICCYTSHIVLTTRSSLQLKRSGPISCRFHVKMSNEMVQAIAYWKRPGQEGYSESVYLGYRLVLGMLMKIDESDCLAYREASAISWLGGDQTLTNKLLAAR